MKAKKAIALMLGLCMACGVAFAGCGSAGDDSGTTPPGTENPGGENPGGENPGGENPGGENPGGENPGGENPGGENPGGENPGGETPGTPEVEYPDIPDIPPDDEIIVPDYDRPFDDSQKYTYTESFRKAFLSDYTVEEVAGASSKKYTSNAGGLFAVNQTNPFPYGTFSATVKTVPGSDSGIVFGLTAPTTGEFWESNAGVNYYFFFVNQGGYAHLAKVGLNSGGTFWQDLRVEQISGFNTSGTYRLKVVFKSNKICCFVNGNLMVAYRDSELLTGTGYGLRTQGTGVVFSDIALTNDYLYEE